jgi:DNA-binding NarL/FixJ family response regulator
VNEQTQEKRIRLVLLDSQALFRAGLSHLFALQPGLEVVGECAGPDEALEILKNSPVDLVLLDLDGGVEGARAFMSAARSSGYDGRFLILAGAADPRKAAGAIRRGASGIFLKAEAPERLIHAITMVASGALWITQRIVQILANESRSSFGQPQCLQRGDLLSDREQRVLLGILGGLTNKKIGDELGLSEGCVKVSVRRLFYKAGVRKRSQLVRAALEGSLIVTNTKGLAKRVRNAPTASTFGDRRTVNRLIGR